MAGEIAESTRIYVFDDDLHPEGRATRVVERLLKRGYKTELIKTFTGLKEGVLKGSIRKDALFVVDSTIEESGRPSVTFSETLPWITGAGGINPRNLMPASGGLYGFMNNEMFRTWLEVTRHYVCSMEQMGIAATGIGGDPESVVKRIETYYETLHPDLGEGQGPGSLK